MNLSQVGTGQAVTWNGRTLTVDFRADGGVPLQTIAGLNMAKYKYDDVAGQWNSHVHRRGLVGLGSVLRRGRAQRRPQCGGRQAGSS